jgi:thiol-disulfide isomerase/thioredoxin
MNFLDLNTASTHKLKHHLATHHTLVACLCAAWCDVCNSYRSKFEALAMEHPDLLFLWIDVEDQAETFGDMEMEDFPTILIQHHGIVTFFGTMQPETRQLKRMIKSQAHQSIGHLKELATKNGQHKRWQGEANLLERLKGM